MQRSFIEIEDEDAVEQGEFQGQSVQLTPEGAEWREYTGRDGKPLGAGRGTYAWEYACPVCGTEYFAGAEAHSHVCGYCEITHLNTGAAGCRTPRSNKKIPAARG